jgi:hypothetical protein
LLKGFARCSSQVNPLNRIAKQFLNYGCHVFNTVYQPAIQSILSLGVASHPLFRGNQDLAVIEGKR